MTVEALKQQVLELQAAVQGLQLAVGDDGAAAVPDAFGLPLGGDGSALGTFRVEDGKITHCRFYAAHAVVELADVDLGENPGGTWYLNVPHDSPAGASVSKTAGQNNDDNTAMPLFELNDDLEIVKDYRAMPFIPIYA